MTIASELQALATDVQNARTAITTKGGTVTPDGGTSQLATDIATIPTGVTPTGTISITANGVHDVTQYASANVNVSGGSSKKWGVSVDNLWRTSNKSTPDLEDLVIPSGECPKILGYTFRYAGLKSIYIDDADGINFASGSNGTQYAFAENRNLESALIDCGDRTSSIGSFSLNYAFLISVLSNPPENPPATFELRIKYINGQSCMSYTFQNNVFFKYFSFPNTERIGSLSYTPLPNCFYNTHQCYKQEQASINQFRFPVLTQIGHTSSTSYYGAFKTAFISTSSSTYHYGEILLPELTMAYCKSSNPSNGHFNGCNALNKVYLPKLSNIGTGTTYSKYMFSSSTNITEIHFGIENEATIQAMDGYASKFGATNATLYFDLVNHITVDGTVYDRSGAEYDYDNSYYSWKNGTTVIYTTDALTPAVGDVVYTKSGTTYTQTGTITAIA